MRDFIQALPKAELHVHLEGTLEPEHIFALAQRNGIALEYERPEDVVAAYDFHDLPSFLKIYYAAMDVLREEEDFYELAWHYFQRAAAQYNKMQARMRKTNPSPTHGLGLGV